MPVAVALNHTAAGESRDLRRIPAKIFRCLEESDAFRGGGGGGVGVEASQRECLIRKVAILCCERRFSLEKASAPLLV